MGARIKISRLQYDSSKVSNITMFSSYTAILPMPMPARHAEGTPDFITPARCSYDMAVQLGGPTNLVEPWRNETKMGISDTKI